MTYNFEDSGMPAFLVRAEQEAARVIFELGVNDVRHCSKKETRMIASRVDKAARHINLFMGRKVALTATPHFIFQSREQPYPEQEDILVIDGLVEGIFKGLLVTDHLLVAGEVSSTSKVVVVVDTIISYSADEDGEITVEEPVRSLTRVADLTSFSVGLREDLN